MEELIRCKNCRSQKWVEVGTVTTGKLGKSYGLRKLYQCGNCKRIVMVEGDMPLTSDPLLVF